MNWHGVFRHIDIMLENRSASPTTYYYINQWAKPALRFERHLQVIAASEVIEADASEIINASSSTYVFDIEACPLQIANAWVEYYHNTADKISDNHCATAAQWFLSTFADIPEPSPISSPINLHQLALGLFISGFSPTGINSPGRIMDNAKFYIEARKIPDLAQHYATLLLQVCATLSRLTLADNLTGLIEASSCLSPLSCTPTRFGLFKSTNVLARKEHLMELKEPSMAIT